MSPRSPCRFLRICRPPRSRNFASLSSANAARTSSLRHGALFRLAIVGSGPAGFYTAYRVLSKLPNAQVDMYEALPVPFGLVRHGVAPDHPEVKNCQEKFEEVASSPNFRFIGNVSIGRTENQAGNQCTVELQSLMQHYNSVLLAYGASEDRKLGIPGESTLRGIYSARAFVGWYNGLPDYANLRPDLTRGEEAVIIGQGNVALDIARILLEDIDVLRKTDITEHALSQLAESRIKRVHVVGRRGPMQAAFTIKEVRELMKLSDVSFYPVERSLIPDDLKILPRAHKRLMEVLVKGTPTVAHGVGKAWSLDSCRSPLRFLGKQDSPQDVAYTELGVTKLLNPFEPQSKIESTNTSELVPSDIVFRSVGYKSTPLCGFRKASIQFDESRGIINNDGLGRATCNLSVGATPAVTNQHVPGIYCAGWVKRGPTGVIASTMQDAFTTADTIATDWLSGVPFMNGEQEQAVCGWEGVKQEAGSAADRAITWDQWRKIDLAEKERGHGKGKVREKFTTINEMLAVV